MRLLPPADATVIHHYTPVQCSNRSISPMGHHKVSLAEGFLNRARLRVLGDQLDEHALNSAINLIFRSARNSMGIRYRILEACLYLGVYEEP